MVGPLLPSVGLGEFEVGTLFNHSFGHETTVFVHHLGQTNLDLIFEPEKKRSGGHHSPQPTRFKDEWMREGFYFLFSVLNPNEPELPWWNDAGRFEVMIDDDDDVIMLQPEVSAADEADVAFLSAHFSISERQFWTADMAEMMAGDPKPWVMREKLVRCRCILGSRFEGWGRLLPNGDLSCPNRSTSSLTACLNNTIFYLFI